RTAYSRCAELQKISSADGARRQPKAADTVGTAPVVCSVTSPVAANVVSDTPPRYTDPSSATSGLRSGSASLAWQLADSVSPTSRHRPAFPVSRSSDTSNTAATGTA